MVSDDVRLESETDVDFIVSELESHFLKSQTVEGARSLYLVARNPIAEVLAKLKHAQTHKEFQCGSAALKRFGSIARRLIKDRSDAPDWEPRTLSDHLKSTFLTYLFGEGVSCTSQIVIPWLEASLKYVRARHRPLVHYIPCVAVEIGAKDTYSFGAITFKRKSIFFTEIESGLATYERARDRLSRRAYRNSTPQQQNCLSDRSAKRPKSAAETFQQFAEGVEWVAIIHVERCDRAVSEKRAEAALRIALSASALLLQGTEGANLRVAGDPFDPWKKDKLSSTGSQMFRHTSSWRFGTPEADQNWQSYLDSVAAPVLGVIHELINQTLSGVTLSYGFRLALRAITWYADAVRDTNPETRLIKCATAIECLVVPTEGKATASFVIRGSMLAQREDWPMIDCAAIASELYKKRSAIAHGNITELPSESESTSRALSFTRNVVLQFLAICVQLRPLGAHRNGTREDFVDFYNQCEARFASEIEEIKKRGLHTIQKARRK
jgi:hypothetical protein